MRKTEGITKYEVQWQLIRSSIKGAKTELEDKLEEAQAYFMETRTYDRWERVYNWLEGLQRGYKASKNLVAIARIKVEMGFYETVKSTYVVLKDDYSLNAEEQEARLQNASDKAVKTLWEDLFRTNEKWLKKGYFHSECNAFMDWMYVKSDFTESERYSMKHLKELRALCGETDNTHNFFF